MQPWAFPTWIPPIWIAWRGRERYFSNCFVTAASCAPARASFFTGYYPHTTGVYKNADVWRHSWVEDLAAAGYHCVNIGKMHTYPYETPLGFHERFVVENKDRYLEGRYFSIVGIYSCRRRDWSSNSANCIANGPTTGSVSAPLSGICPSIRTLISLWVIWRPGGYAPSRRLGLSSCRSAFPARTRPTTRFRAMPSPICEKELPLPQLSPGELDAQPAAQKELREHNTRIDHDSIVWLHDPTREQLHRQRAYYLANVTMIDEKIGQILQALEEQGYLENAVVIFTSDHGDCLGDHGHIEKWTMYDIITRVPCIVWAPGRYAPGRQLDALVQQIDLAPLIMELAGLPVPEAWEALSVAPLMRADGATSHRDYVFAEQSRDATLTDTEMEIMVRSADWKLVYYLGSADGELYDLGSDPGEHVNLWGNPAVPRPPRPAPGSLVRLASA